MNHYLTPIRITTGPHKGATVQVDIYDLIAAHGITNVGQIQAAKKVLRGGRADKGWRQDMIEAIDSLTRALEIEEGATK